MKAKNIDIALIQEPGSSALPKHLAYVRLDPNIGAAKAAIIYNNKKIKIKEGHKTKNIASLFLEDAHRLIEIISVYVEPRSVNTFEECAAYIAQASRTHLVIAAGDFNARHDLWDDTTNELGVPMAELVDTTQLEHYFPDEYTFSGPQGSSTIDHCLHSHELVIESTLLDEEVNSDHRPIVHKVALERAALLLPPHIQSRIFHENKEKLLAFQKALESETGLRQDKDLLAKLNQLIHHTAIETLGPKKPPKEYIPRHWVLSEEASALKARAKKLKNKLSTYPHGPEKDAKYREYLDLKNDLDAMLRDEALRFWNEFIESDDDWGPAYRIVKQKITPRVNKSLPGHDYDSYLTSLKAFFPGIKRVDEPSRAPATPQSVTPAEPCLRASQPGLLPDLSNAFSLSPLLDTATPEDDVPPPSWPKITTDWVHKRLSTQNPRKAPGIDGITGSMARAIPVNRAADLARALSLCLVNNHFPDELKTANVCAIPKTGKDDYEDPKSFRPISLLTLISKMLETIINESLQPILEEKLSEFQFGFRPGKSTVLTLQGVDNWASTKRHLKKALIAIDFTCAFDYAPHKKIIAQLVEWGVPGHIVDMLRSYLRNRKISYQGHTYQLGDVGCPQGSILGPALWNVLVNSLIVKLNKAGLALAYADDVTICINARNTKDLERDIKAALRMATQWAKENGLVINKTKTVIMPVHCDWSKDIEGVKCVQSTKVLGVILDKHWSFKPHIQAQVKKGRILLSTWNRYVRSSNRLLDSCRPLFVKGALRPMLHYGLAVWGKHAKATNLQKIARLERNALVMALGAYRTTSYNDLHAISGMTTIEKELELLSITGPTLPLKRVNRVVYGPLEHRGVPSNPTPDTLILDCHLSSAKDCLIARTRFLDRETTHKLEPSHDWLLLSQQLIVDCLSLAEDTALQDRKIIIRADMNPSGKSTLPIFWLDCLDRLSRLGTKIYAGDAWEAPVFPRDELQDYDFTNRHFCPRAARRLTRAKAVETHRASAKPDIKTLVAVERYPFLEQVWLATGHGPFPDYLARFRAKFITCKCGEAHPDWYHVMDCAELGPPLNFARKDIFKPAYARHIVRRVRSLQTGGHVEPQPNMIPLPAPTRVS